MTQIEAALDPDQARREAAEKVRRAKNINLPPLKYWNYDPCSHHEVPRVDCEWQACGGEPFDHQRVGIVWLYLIKRGLLADVTGAGKTIQTLGLLALMKERGELTDRAVVICQTAAVLQWLEEANRWTPRVNAEAVYGGMTRAKRISRYSSNWDVLFIGWRMAQQDHDILQKLEIGTVIVDDVDALLDHGNATHRVVVDLANRANRSVVINATNVQVRLEQLHAATVPVDGHRIFGSLPAFSARYIRKEKVTVWLPSGKRKSMEKTTGFRNLADLKRRLAPIFLRRNYEDLQDIRMPEIMPPENIWLELHPAQRAKYTELQRGVLRIRRETGDEVKYTEALAKFTYGQEICAGLPALGEPDGPEASIKLDWLEQRLNSEWVDQKIVVMIRNKGLVSAFQNRLDRNQVGYETIWGNEPSSVVRKAAQDRFWRDPNCRVMMGTSAMERSLNLQISNIIVFVDTVLNPARVTQTVGRIRRPGKHDHIFVFCLFCRDTQEEGYLNQLKRRQAVADAVNEEQSELYESLSPMELLALITP